MCDTLKDMYEQTDLTLQELADYFSISIKRVYKFVNSNYSVEYRRERKRRCYRKSKLGDKNPMTGLFREQHPNYKGIVSDDKTYYLIVKPSWYTGRKKSKHIFYHHKVVCENLGITEVPRGYAVHHCDFDHSNNNFDNLVMLTHSEHTRLHRILKGATTISKESTLKWVEALRQGLAYDLV